MHTPPAGPRMRVAAAAAAAISLGAASCTGPKTHVHNPGEHRVFLDGRLTKKQELPFRFYGTSRWDAQPKDVVKHNGELGPDWDLLPASGTIEQPAPVPTWLFPFDFPLELLSLVVAGQPTFEGTVTLPELPPEHRPTRNAPPIERDRVAARARQARIQRGP